MKIELSLPLKDILVTQPFGVNYVDYYKKLGLKGHGGIDFKAHIGMPLYASHDGEVIFAGTDNGGGKSVTIASDMGGDGYKTIYYHMSRIDVKKGKRIKTGYRIGNTGNTGKYTTGPHLHLGLKIIKNGKTVNHGNGYRGAIDPAPYLKEHWNKSNSYHRYGRKGSWYAEFLMRFKNPWLHRKLNKYNRIHEIYNNEFMNALIYGGWDVNTVLNPSMREVWAYIKKDEFKKGVQPFGRTRTM